MFIEGQQIWFISLRDCLQRKMKETSLFAWPPALTNGDWLMGPKYLEGVNSRDGEKLLSVVQGDRRANDGNESQNKDDLGSWASLMP